MLIKLICPICRKAIGLASDGSTVQIKCWRRRCEQPVVTFTVANGRALPRQMVDRHAKPVIG